MDPDAQTEAQQLLQSRLYQSGVAPAMSSSSSSSAPHPGLSRAGPKVGTGSATSSTSGLGMSRSASGRGTLPVRGGKARPPVPHTTYRPITLAKSSHLDGKGGVNTVSRIRHEEAEEERMRMEAGHSGAFGIGSPGGVGSGGSSPSQAGGGAGGDIGLASTMGRDAAMGAIGDVIAENAVAAGGGHDYAGGTGARRAPTAADMQDLIAGTGDGGQTGQTGADGGSWINPRDFVEFVSAHDALREEFCYMTRGGQYEFRIIPFDKVDPSDYMTISSRGVTHFNNGDLTFVSLADWEVEQEMYSKIAKIPFFAKYAKWKLWSTWKRGMMANRLKKCSKALNNNVFALDCVGEKGGPLHKSIMRIRALCVEVSTWNMLEIPQRQTWTLAEFQQAQGEKVQQTAVKLYDVWESVRAELNVACAEALEIFLEQNGFGKEAKEAERKEAELNGRVAETSYTERATTRTQCRKLTKFIKTAQYLLNTGITEMIKFSTNRLLQLLEKFNEKFAMEAASDEDGGQMVVTRMGSKGRAGMPKDPAGYSSRYQTPSAYPDNIAPTFIIECMLRDGDIVFKPSGNKFRNYLEQALFEGLKAVTRLPQFVNLSELSMYTSDSDTADPNAKTDEAAAQKAKANSAEAQIVALKSQSAESAKQAPPSELAVLVIADPAFKALLQKIGTNFDLLFGKVIEYASQYKGFAEMFVDNEKLQNPAVDFADAPLEDLIKALDTYKGQQDAMRAIQPVKNLNFFELDSSRLQELLLPSPVRCWDLMCAYIPRLMMERQKEVSHVLTEGNEKLSKVPVNVEEFVAYDNYLQEFNTEMDKLETK